MRCVFETKRFGATQERANPNKHVATVVIFMHTPVRCTGMARLVGFAQERPPLHAVDIILGKSACAFEMVLCCKWKVQILML